jgi:membrane protease YdiL (CAAX protease family)
MNKPGKNIRSYRDELIKIPVQAFIPDREPVPGNSRRSAIPGLIVFGVSSVFWFLMNVSFQGRFLPVPYQATIWFFISLGLNLCFGIGLLIFPKSRPYALVPFVFTLFPAAFLIMTLLGEPLQKLIPPSAAAGGLDWKFIYDDVFFLAELVFMFLFLGLSRTGNPFSLKRNPALPLKPLIRFLEGLFIVVVLFLMALLLYNSRFPPSRFLQLLKYQIPFAILLGLKEELLFRWVLPRLGERLMASRLTAVCFVAVLWALYHGLFGEGVGTGFGSAAAVCIASFWWSLLSYRYNSIWSAWLGHTVVELYGFYLMYIPFLV